MELFRALGTLAEPPSVETPRLSSLLGLGEPPRPGEYEELFLFQLYPYASVYLGPEGKMGGEARDRIAGFWRALELEPPPEPDHLALLLGLHARLAELESEAGSDTARRAWGHARKAWLWEHLLSWLPVYLVRAGELGSRFYRAWAQLLLRALGEEARDLGLPVHAPLHLREAPPLADPRLAPETPEAELLDQLLSPARTGFVLTTTDLRRAAFDLELGLRAGERRFALEALIAQDAVATLDWLAGFAEARAKRHAANELAVFEPVMSLWVERACASATLLGELATDAREASQHSTRSD